MKTKTVCIAALSHKDRSVHIVGDVFEPECPTHKAERCLLKEVRLNPKTVQMLATLYDVSNTEEEAVEKIETFGKDLCSIYQKVFGTKEEPKKVI